MKHAASRSLLLSALLSLGVWLAIPRAASADDALPQAKRNYDTYCVQCHGVNRNGNGVNSRDMSVQPRDHTDAKGMADIPNDEIFRAIKEGGLAVNKSVLMPAWGNVLPDDEVKELVAYLRQVCKCGSTN